MTIASENQRVTCRVQRKVWAVVCMGTGLVLFMLVFMLFGIFTGPPRPLWDIKQLLVLVAIMMALMGTPFVVSWIWIARATYIADQYGLHWRGIGRWRHAAWEDVKDYYVKAVKTNNSGNQTFLVLETAQAKISFNEDAYTHVPEMRDWIQQYATAAKAKSWGEWQERPADLPQTFGYEVRRYRHAPQLLKQWHALTLTVVVLYFGYRWVTAHTLPGWGWLLTPTGLFLIAKEIILLILHPISAETRRRMEQRITVTVDGVVFEDGARRIAAAWDDVTSIYTTGFAVSCYVVETTQGDFDFLGTLRDSLLLQKLLLRLAVSTGQTQWQVRAAVPSRRSQGGEKVYTYCTEAAQKMIAAPFSITLLALFLVGGMVWATWTPGAALSSGERDALALMGVLVLVCIWLLWRYHAAWIRTDASGITQATIFGRRFIPWEQVQDFYWSGSRDLAFGNIVGTYSRLRFWAGIADADMLVEEITERAVTSRSRVGDAEEGATT